MGFKTTKKVFTIYQFEEILILLKRNLVFWLGDIIERHSYKKQKNQDSQALV